MFFERPRTPNRARALLCHLTTYSQPDYREEKMDVTVTEEQIRTLAFYLWEKDGGPEGRSEEYWEKARQQLLADASPATSDADTMK
ncbi:DUF2934 domain-containing protein [Paraburkholderia diazotrophica]|uniref:DUF2934 domain-containing protein n=1 Tax=Paraburkholderia diazotrophica TaxID=667676 RepID=UPI00316BEEC7